LRSAPSGRRRPARAAQGRHTRVRRGQAVRGAAASRLALPWTILRFGQLTEHSGNAQIDTVVRAGAPLTTGRDVAALAITDALERPHVAHQIVNVLDGERQVADALAAIEPLPLPPPGSPHRGVAVPLGVAQADNPPDDPKMIEPDAPPLDADVEWVGDGPVPPEPVGNDDPAPGIP
jgi:hypothetical protein